jgi:hypothetical protein
MLSPQSWLPFTDGLEIGRKMRVSHDCGEGKTLIISRGDNGYSAWCFRCGDRGWAPGPQESLSDKLARMAHNREADAVLAAVQRMPEPACHDVDNWPTAAALWFYRAGLSRADIGNLGAYFHKPSGRVVLRVKDYWQARALDGRQPKYIGSTNRPPSLIARWGSAPSPTLCEDILSAYKVGLVGEGWAIMGTSIPSAYIAELMRRNVRVNIWLDPDAAGRRAAAKYKKQLQAYGLEVNDILSTRDPKLHTRAQIKGYLDGRN